MVTELVCPELNTINLMEMWNQQDGATPHIVNKTIELFNEKNNDEVNQDV